MTELVERFTVAGANPLTALAPGTGQRLWYSRLAPELVAAGVLVKRGHGFFGRRSAIVRALLERPATAAVPSSSIAETSGRRAAPIAAKSQENSREHEHGNGSTALGREPLARVLLTYAEVAQLTGVKRTTLRAWVARRRIPHVRLGGRTAMFDHAEILRWIDEHRVVVEVN